MKTLMSQCIVGAASLLCISNVFAHDRECSLETLSGLYVFNATGFSLVAGVWQPKAIVEYLRLNGDGTATAESATVANRAGDGAITRSTGTTATYTLDADCKGSLQFDHGPAFDIFTTPRSGQLQMIQTNPNNVLQGNARKVSR
ncbi:MAG: hypothetical protein ACJ8OJ_04520 [Povalibacter sp.]